MTWFTGLLVFVIIWWMVLFIVLPWGVRQPDRVEPGHDPGAPARPMLWRKAAITTGVAALLWIAAYLLITSDLISFRGPP